MRRLSAFCGEMTSVEHVLRRLERKSGKLGKVRAADLYTRSLDCRNLGGYAMLQRVAALAASYGELQRGMHQDAWSIFDACLDSRFLNEQDRPAMSSPLRDQCSSHALLRGLVRCAFGGRFVEGGCRLFGDHGG